MQTTDSTKRIKSIEANQGLSKEANTHQSKIEAQQQLKSFNEFGPNQQLLIKSAIKSARKANKRFHKSDLKLKIPSPQKSISGENLESSHFSLHEGSFSIPGIIEAMLALIFNLKDEIFSILTNLG